MAKQQVQPGIITATVLTSLTSGTYVFTSLDIDGTGRLTNLVSAPGPGLAKVSGTPGSISVTGTNFNPVIGLFTSTLKTTAGFSGNGPLTFLKIDANGRITDYSPPTQSANLGVSGSPLGGLVLDQFGYVSGIVTGTVTATNLVSSGTTFIGQTSELYNTKTGATGVVTHDFSTGHQWYHSSIASNFTANFTNFVTTSTSASPNNTYVVNILLMLQQGNTPYIPTGVQINGTAKTIKWFGGVVPVGTANRFEEVSFTFISTQSNNWTVLGSFSTWA